MGRPVDDLDAADFLGLDLDIDHAVTALQAYRWYGVTQLGLAARGFALESRMVKPTKGSRQPRAVTFVLADEELRGLSSVALLHLAGAAEMRFVLKVGRVVGGPQAWVSSAQREAAPFKPDALWERPDGARVAIEFDSTHYDNDRIAEKARRFLEFDAQVWGAPTEERVASLKERVLAVDPRASVVVADPLRGLK